MKALLTIGTLLFLFPLMLCGQLLDSVSLASMPIYTSLEKALENPSKVYRLRLRGTKLKEVPPAVFEFPNLQELDLARNRIKRLPSDISKLKNLQILDISRNKIDSLPVEIGQLKNLNRLVIYMNPLAQVPTSFCQLTSLQYLDAWGTGIHQFPDCIVNLRNSLKWIDFRLIQMSYREQDKMEEQLPNTSILFSEGCNCN